MRTRTGLVAAVAVLVTLPVSATAGTCTPELRDATGDATEVNTLAGGPYQTVNSPQLDILGVDFSSDREQITVVLSLAELAVVEPTAPAGRAYYANFVGGGSRLYLSALLDTTGTVFRTGVIEGPRRTLGEASGEVDHTKREIRITAPFSAFGTYSKKLTPGTRVLGLNALSQRYVGSRATGGFTSTADSAHGSAGTGHRLGSRC